MYCNCVCSVYSTGLYVQYGRQCSGYYGTPEFLVRAPGAWWLCLYTVSSAPVLIYLLVLLFFLPVPAATMPAVAAMIVAVPATVPMSVGFHFF